MTNISEYYPNQNDTDYHVEGQGMAKSLKSQGGGWTQINDLV
jgi:hypothetical protein